MQNEHTDLDAATGSAAFVLRLRERGVRDTAVLRAMEQVPRERFAPAHLRAYARRDIALPLPCGQTMTAPNAVAAMLAALDVTPSARALEIGTGSGYVTALLARLGAEVTSLERSAVLLEAAHAVCHAEGVAAKLRRADGLAEGAAGQGGFDRILLNGLVPAVPPHLVRALGANGRLVAALATGEGPRLLVLARNGGDVPVPSLGPSLRLPALMQGLTHVI